MSLSKRQNVTGLHSPFQVFSSAVAKTLGTRSATDILTRAEELKMGNAPSESNMGASLRCCVCYRGLPPCSNFSDYTKFSPGNNVEAYVYNGGEYYREVGHDNQYMCSSCFHEKINRMSSRQ
ncbi:hypothetical protein AGOR_G00042870 [Albula goreensis]|uniref:Uncharacterized protein n=1 Tax=Albula goreensis TaxID=1534307 RepID=A0A8T3E0R5_9TELE|nr:hypothetical protein AGOR_G00042870 [Albula goreensis]